MKHYDEQDYRKNKIDWNVLRKLLPRVYPYRWILLFCGALLLCSSLLSLAGPLLIRHAIDIEFVKKDLYGLYKIVIIYFFILVISFVISYFQRVNIEIAGQKIIKQIRIDVFSHLTGMNQRFFDSNPVGQLLSRVESDTESLRALFTNTIVIIISDVLMMAGMIVIMFSISTKLTLILLSLAPFVIISIFYFNGKIVPVFIEVRKKTAEIYGFLEEYLKGSRVVQVFDQEENVIIKMDRVNKSRADIEYPGHVMSTYFGNTIFLISTVAISMILGIGGKWVIERPDELTVGTLVAFLGYIYRFFGPIFHLSDQINVIQKAFGGAKRINDLLAIPLTGYEESDNSVFRSERKGIEFKNVWFAYKDEEWILKDISFFLPEGHRLAIVGPTGGGKTTLANLLFRFYEPQKGHIFIDGIDISRIPLRILRKRLGLVLQDIILFHGTILDNLRLEENSIGEEQVIKALETINAKDLIDRFPDGLNTGLSEHGSNMSMGERQLLSFARALVFDRDILVLDEATSSVDPLTEKKLQNAVTELLKGRTSIIIAHRLQTIIESDIIFVIKDGTIKEKGNHKELLDIKGIYWHLYNIQAGLTGEQVKQVKNDRLPVNK
ncbi:MAG: ABC transporter ATP-binding protein [Candidatus Eremiobacterota bacterium]